MGYGGMGGMGMYGMPGGPETTTAFLVCSLQLFVWRRRIWGAVLTKNVSFLKNRAPEPPRAWEPTGSTQAKLHSGIFLRESELVFLMRLRSVFPASFKGLDRF